MNYRRTATRLTAIFLGCVALIIAADAKNLRASPTVPDAPWRHEMKLIDSMGIYDFPEELVAFPITCPANTVRKEHLKLLGAADDSPLEYQLSDVVERGGYLVSATVHFRSDLPRNTTRAFQLVCDPAYTARFVPRVSCKKDADGAICIRANRQQLRVPADAVAASFGPAPILGISRDGGVTWIGGGSLLLPPSVTLKSVRATVVEEGPLSLKYGLRYTFNSDRTWQVDLTVQHNEKHVLVDESLSGFSAEDKAFWNLSYRNNLEPDARLVMCNGGYNAGSRGMYCGAYDRDLRADGALPYQLGLFTPNSYGVMRSTAFFNDHGASALLFAINRPRDWQTPTRHAWSDMDAPENLYFFQRDGDAYARLALVGRKRHWALSLIPRDELLIGELPVSPEDQGRKKAEPRRYVVRKDLEGYPRENIRQYGAGPEVRLWQKLTDFSLNAYKDMLFDFDEPLTPYDPQGDRCSYDEYWLKGQDHGRLRDHIYLLVQRYWDLSSELQHGFGGGNVRKFQVYANSRAGWTAEQRRRIRSILVFVAHFAAEDSFSPHTSMMGGHPNFVADIKLALPLAAVVFPAHPHAARWKSEFLGYWQEWLDVYTRRGNPQQNAQGGRWMENVACYWIASLERASVAAEALLKHDGTHIFTHRRFQDVVRWTLDALAPCEEPCRRVVPIGAHSYSTPQQVEPLRHAAELLQKCQPQLAQQLLWCLTSGKEGVKPQLRSRLYADYGAVLWHDFGGPHEAFLTIQQLNGRGYRWSTESNGALYYATKEQRWSWNGAEQNGDSFDITRIPLFNVNGKSLGAHEADGVLYDFAFVQYYKAAGSNPAYPWRGVMMLGDECLAVYDHLSDPSAAGTFQWRNEEAHLRMECFARPDFTDLRNTSVPRTRFPLKYDWGNAPPLESTRPGPFSVRWTGMLLPETAGEYAIVAEIGGDDAARIWLDDQMVFDSAAGKPIPRRLAAGRLVDVKVEYAHHGGAARINVKWGTDKLVPPQHGSTLCRLPMPQVYTVKAGPGDQLHLVAPKPHKVEARPFGAIVDDKQYVFHGAQTADFREGPVVFCGASGYAREKQVAVFEGTKVGFGDLLLERNGGDFGVSASRQADGSIVGRFAGRSGGSVTVSLPAGFDISRCQVRIGGAVAPHTTAGRAIHFDVHITQADGCQDYAIIAK